MRAKREFLSNLSPSVQISNMTHKQHNHHLLCISPLASLKVAYVTGSTRFACSKARRGELVIFVATPTAGRRGTAGSPLCGRPCEKEDQTWSRRRRGLRPNLCGKSMNEREHAFQQPPARDARRTSQIRRITAALTLLAIVLPY